MSPLPPTRTNWELESFEDWRQKEYVDDHHSSRTVVEDEPDSPETP